MQTTLLLIDIQKVYFPGGAMPLVNSVAAGEKAGRLLKAFRSRRLPVIHIQHISTRSGATFFLPGTPGVDIHDCVKPMEDEPVFIKNYPNSFRDTGLLQRLRRDRRKDLVIAGMMTHMCIDATTRAAFDLGFSCTVAHDACATRDLCFSGKTIEADRVHTAFMASFQGFFAEVMSTEDVCSRLLLLAQ